MHRVGLLFYANFYLKCSDIGHNPIDLVVRDARNGRHVSKRPMMPSDTLANGPMECGVAMMARLVDAMNQRRAFVASGSAWAVAASTFYCVKLRSAFRPFRYLTRSVGSLRAHGLRVELLNRKAMRLVFRSSTLDFRIVCRRKPGTGVRRPLVVTNLLGHFE